jgi:hypothetical protein
MQNAKCKMRFQIAQFNFAFCILHFEFLEGEHAADIVGPCGHERDVGGVAGGGTPFP